MLNDYEIPKIKCIFIAIDSEQLSESYCEELVDYVMQKKRSIHIYMVVVE